MIIRCDNVLQFHSCSLSKRNQCCGSASSWCRSGSGSDFLFLCRSRSGSRSYPKGLTQFSKAKQGLTQEPDPDLKWYKLRIRIREKVSSDPQHRAESYKESCSGYIELCDSVADPIPDPQVFGPPGSGSNSQRYGPRSGSYTESGSGSFYHHAKIVRKTLIPNILWFFFTFYFWKMMYE